MKSTLLVAALLAVSRAIPTAETTGVALWNNLEPQIKAEASSGGDKSQANTEKAQSTDAKKTENAKSEDANTEKTESKGDTESKTDDSKSKSEVKTDDSKSKTDDSKSKTDGSDSKTHGSDHKTDHSESKTDDSSSQTDASKTDDNSKTDSDSKQKKTSQKPAGTRLFANSTSTISINPNLPAGMIVLTVPTSTENTYVKAGEYATFEWTFTNLIVTPTAVNVEAYCSANMQTYTIATNQSVDNTRAVWNTSDVLATAEVGLMTAQYTLYIYDSNATATSISSAGFLSPMSYIFGVYLPQKYTPWAKSYDYINIASMLSPPRIMTGLLGALGLVFVGLMV